ncbi:hypothetical protein [Endozoicomonas euniceicola]|uniref:Uncharacterized protein n=1 Tax=Endozoicomonas euniceicola TaxID=1234143 RepID=A0ABY6GWQ6_9GAMM|nr:hypothetical protein [Endozoicomonas euniceicola]UYM16511.1 hypothetical protein NX720_00820 [Endozoicomonas euniceicola]
MYLTAKKLSNWLILGQLFLVFPLYAGKKINLSINSKTSTVFLQNSTQSTSTSEENPALSVSVSSTSNDEDSSESDNKVEQLSEFMERLRADILNDFECISTGQAVANPDIDLSVYSNLVGQLTEANRLSVHSSLLVGQLTEVNRLSVFDVTVQRSSVQSSSPTPIQSNESSQEFNNNSSRNTILKIQGDITAQKNDLSKYLNKGLNQFYDLLLPFFTSDSNTGNAHFIFLFWIDENNALNLFRQIRLSQTSTVPQQTLTEPFQQPLRPHTHFNRNSGCSLQ